MRFDVITIFPGIFDSYLKEALVSRSLKKKLIEFNVHDLRDWTDDRRKTIDGRPFGGNLGMVMKIEPILKAVLEIKKKNKKSKVVVFTPRGKKLNQKKVHEFSKLDQLIMICGRYEGIDERVSRHIADEEISIGDYVLMGGELPSMVLTESMIRLVPGAIGKESFLTEKIKKEKRKTKGMVECSQYTRPEVFEPGKVIKQKDFRKYKDVKIKNKTLKEIAGSKWRVPKDLVSGDHRKIEEKRKKNEKLIWE